MFGTIKQVQKDFMSFAAYDKVFLTVAAAICVGLATKEAIGNLMNEVILPFVLFISKGSIAYIAYSTALEKTIKIGWVHAFLQAMGKMIWIFVVWMIILYITYAVFRKLITVDYVTPRVEMVENVAAALSNRGGSSWMLSSVS